MSSACFQISICPAATYIYDQCPIEFCMVYHMYPCISICCYIYLLQAANALMLYMYTDTCCHLFLVTYMCVHGHELLSRSHEWQLYISILIHIRISLLPCFSCHIYASIYIFLGIILFDLAEYA